MPAGWQRDLLAGVHISPWLTLLIAILNPFFEEALVVGYLVPALETSVGRRGAVLASASVRALYHTYQGIPAALSILLMGLVYGGAYRRWHSLWPLILPHALFDFVGFWIGRGTA